MKRYEYMELTNELNDLTIREINSYAKEGWRVIHINHLSHISDNRYRGKVMQYILEREEQNDFEKEMD